jgi:hypothetical protein
MQMRISRRQPSDKMTGPLCLLGAPILRHQST